MSCWRNDVSKNLKEMKYHQKVCPFAATNYAAEINVDDHHLVMFDVRYLIS